MKRAYFLTFSRSGERHRIAPNAEREFFDAIEGATGLDRPMAERLLERGPIVHPLYKFEREDSPQE